MVAEKPYFMKNKNWFFFDYKKFKFVLTNDAPPEAVDSYNKFYEAMLSDKNDKEQKKASQLYGINIAK